MKICWYLLHQPSRISHNKHPVRQTGRHTNRHTGKQNGKQRNKNTVSFRQTDWQTKQQIGRQKNWKYRPTQLGKKPYRQTDWQAKKELCSDKLTDIQGERQTGRQTHRQVDKQTQTTRRANTNSRKAGEQYRLTVFVEDKLRAVGSGFSLQSTDFPQPHSAVVGAAREELVVWTDTQSAHISRKFVFWINIALWYASSDSGLWVMFLQKHILVQINTSHITKCAVSD